MKPLDSHIIRETESSLQVLALTTARIGGPIDKYNSEFRDRISCLVVELIDMLQMVRVRIPVDNSK